MWNYQQSTGKLSDLTGALVGIGYSGHESGKNNPAMQSHRGLGPIPCGVYIVGLPFDSPEHGPYCLRLTPQPENEMFGRSGFLMHGDSIVHPGMASLGCIIQLHATRQRVWESGDHLLEVIP